MINLRAKDEMGTNAAMIFSIIALAGTLLFMLLVPKPTTAGIANKQRLAADKVLDQITLSHQTLDKTTAVVEHRTWPGGAQQVGPGALQAMTKLSKTFSVKLSGFRPQRVTAASGLELLPYSVTAEGSFVNVLRFVKAIEDPTTKLAVHQVQINSADANSDQVTAAIGITAYRVADKVTTTKTTTTTTTVKKNG